MGGGCGLAPREQGKRCLMEDRARHPGDMTALVLHPHFEPGTGAKHQSIQQLMTHSRKRDSLRPGAPSEYLDVNERPWQQRQMERISAELGMAAQLPPQGGEGPAQRSERVVGFREEQARDSFARLWNLAPNQVREQPPRLVAAEGFQADPVLLDPRPPEKVDAQPHVTPATVTRLVTRRVTRRTLTLSRDQFNGR